MMVGRTTWIAALALGCLFSAGPVRAQYLGPPRPQPPLPPAQEAPPDVAPDANVAAPQEEAGPAPSPAPPPPAPAGSPGTPPQRPGESPAERIRIWGNLGAAWAYGVTYVNIGIGGGYVLPAGFLPTLDLNFSFGASPVVFMVRPGIDWFAPLPGGMRPFVGTYFAQWFVSDGFPPRSAWGVRGGLSLAQAGPVFVLLGVAYEQVFTNCTGQCGYFLPQVAVGVGL